MTRPRPALSSTLITLAALAALTACGGSDEADSPAEPDDAPVGGVNAEPVGGVNAEPVGGVNAEPVGGVNAEPVGGVNDPPEEDVQDASDLDPPPEIPSLEGIPAECPAPPPLADALDEPFEAPAAESLCDVSAAPDAGGWHLAYEGRATVSEDLGGGRFRFESEEGELRGSSLFPDCDPRSPHLVVRGLGTTGLAVGDAVRLELNEGVPAPNAGPAYAAGRILRAETGELVAGWGGLPSGHPLRDGGPVLDVQSGEAVCGERTLRGRCSWEQVLRSALRLSAGDDTATLFGGPAELTLDGLTFLAVGSTTRYDYEYACVPDEAEVRSMAWGGLDLTLVRRVR